MCGIAGCGGSIGIQEKVAIVDELNARQKHRGPDTTITHTWGSWCLGNTRLAIQDLTERGNQPFHSSDGRYICVFNGEIYNFRQLQAQFALPGDSSCDGSVIPELWAKFGTSALEHLRGMYAIAVHDRISDTVTLARDPFGIKPLFYRRMPSRCVVFSSEPRALAALKPVPRVRLDAIAAYLHLGSVPAHLSAFEHVEPVPANNAITFDRDGHEVSRAPGLSYPFVDTDGVAGHTLSGSLEESVYLHLISDVPTALLLSSGVDSSAIALMARRLGVTLDCLTISSPGAADEGAAASATASRYGHRHQQILPVLDDDGVGSFFGAMQQPTIDGLNLFMICREVQRAGFKVALSGLGGDEVLGGYSHFRHLGKMRTLRRLRYSRPKVGDGLWRAVSPALRTIPPGKLRRLLVQPPRSAFDLDLIVREVHDPQAVECMTGRDPGEQVQVEGDAAHGLDVNALAVVETMLYLQRMLLPDADAYSMCSSVELRVPFVDRTVVAVAYGERAKGRPAGKDQLVSELDDSYLRALRKAGKRGFDVPMRDWMARGALRPAVAELRSKDAPVWDFVDYRAAWTMLAPGTKRRSWSKEWSLAALNHWLRSIKAQAAEPIKEVSPAYWAVQHRKYSDE